MAGEALQYSIFAKYRRFAKYVTKFDLYISPVAAPVLSGARVFYGVNLTSGPAYRKHTYHTYMHACIHAYIDTYMHAYVHT